MKQWTLTAPAGVAWTPEELRRIALAVQEFQRAVAEFSVFVLVEVAGLEIIPPKIPSRQDLRKSCD